MAPSNWNAAAHIAGELITNAAKQYGHKEAHFVPDKKAVPAFLKSLAKSGDIIVTMGAGDIWKYGEEFFKLLTAKKGN